MVARGGREMGRDGMKEAERDGCDGDDEAGIFQLSMLDAGRA